MTVIPPTREYIWSEIVDILKTIGVHNDILEEVGRQIKQLEADQQTRDVAISERIKALEARISELE